jgi:glucose-6-phosphate isomerase
MIHQNLLSVYDRHTGPIDGRVSVERHLGDLNGSFADTRSYDLAISAANPLLYSVTSVEPSKGPGELYYAVGTIMPGKIGAEYYLTKGHLHAWREATEFYFGLTGSGIMLLEDEKTGESKAVPLAKDTAVYVPGCTAHRTINTGSEPLVYIGVYPSAAGHDYGAIADRNFNKVVVERDGGPVVIDRADYLRELKNS